MSTYAEKVNSLVAQANPDGTLPEGVEADEGLQFAVNAELRRRETQSSYTKSQQTLKALEAETNALATNWEKDAVANLSATDQATLTELKNQDPEAWRAKIVELEEAARTTFKEKRDGLRQEAVHTTALEQRMADLAAFNEANPDFAITDDVIANDLPPRITNKLKSGDITFADFLEEAKAFISTPKTIAKVAVEEEPNFAGARGSRTASEEATAKHSSNTYSKAVF